MNDPKENKSSHEPTYQEILKAYKKVTNPWYIMPTWLVISVVFVLFTLSFLIGLTYFSNSGTVKVFGFDFGFSPQSYSKSLPHGAIISYAGQKDIVVNSSSWLVCDGRSLEKEKYPELYANLLNSGGKCLYGESEDGGLFNIPDLRGRNLIGNGQGKGLTKRHIGEYIGQGTIIISERNLPNHDHDLVFDSGPNVLINDDTYQSGDRPTNGGPNAGISGQAFSQYFRISSDFQNEPIEITPPSLVVNFIIKAR